MGRPPGATGRWGIWNSNSKTPPPPPRKARTPAPRCREAGVDWCGWGRRIRTFECWNQNPVPYQTWRFPNERAQLTRGCESVQAIFAGVRRGPSAPVTMIPFGPTRSVRSSTEPVCHKLLHPRRSPDNVRWASSRPPKDPTMNSTCTPKDRVVAELSVTPYGATTFGTETFNFAV